MVKEGLARQLPQLILQRVLGKEQSVLLVDADSQGSASWWIERGKNTSQFDLRKETDPHLLSNLRQVTNYNIVVVDTPPALRSEALQAVIKSSDYLVLPTPPAPMDLMALIETVQTTVTPINIAHRVLLTKVDPRSLRETLEAQNTLLELGIPACHAFVRSYKAHKRAVLEGVPITEWRGRHAREAEADYRRVAEELQRDWSQL